MNKNVNFYLNAIRSFSTNLSIIDFSNQDSLYQLLLRYILDYLKGTRASFLKFEKDDRILYNKVTIVYKNGFPVLEEINDKLKFCIIKIDDDYRKDFLDNHSFINITNINEVKNLSLEIDNKLELATGQLLIHPIYFQDQFIGLIELTRDENSFEFDETDLAFFESILNILSALISNIYLYEWAIRDELTNSYSITYFYKKLDEFIISKNRYEQPFVIFMMDIDNFKKINDQHGHLSGDQAIIYFTDTIKKFIRDDVDVLARYGGDEFCLLLKNCRTDRAAEIAGRIIKSLSEETFYPDDHQDKGINISVSIGIAEYRIHGEDKDTLLKNADSALYKSKDAGKNCYTVYSP